MTHVEPKVATNPTLFSIDMVKLDTTGLDQPGI